MLAFNSIPVWLKGGANLSFDIAESFELLSKILPKGFTEGVESIYIGYLPADKTNLLSFYDDRAIYLSNNIASVREAVEAIIHEVGHHLLYQRSEELAESTLLEDEFLNKLRQLRTRLLQDGIIKSERHFESSIHSEEREHLLYTELSPEKAKVMSLYIFPSPYSAVSLAEYFCVGLERMLLEPESFRVLQNYCPQLHSIISELWYS